jgi:hypothetical protein
MLCGLEAMPKVEGLRVDAVDAFLTFRWKALVKTCQLGGR